MRRRLPPSVLVPAGLVVLVATLATLQYRWLGQVSEAERDELRTSLERRAAEFADDVDREITRAYTSFQTVEAPEYPRQTPSLKAALDGWRGSTRYPELVKEIYFVQNGAEPGASALFQYAADRDAFTRVEWPSSLDSIRLRAAPNINTLVPAAGMAAPRTQVFTFTNTTVVGEPPAVIVPLASRPVGEAIRAPRPPPGHGATSILVDMRLPHDVLVLMLDRDVIAHALLPALADRHFDSDRYRVAVVDPDGTPVLTRGLAAGASIDPAKADASLPLFSIRAELPRDVRGFATITRPGGAGGITTSTVTSNELSVRIERRSATIAEPLKMLPPSWMVLLQHSAGSLDAAVTQARRRNLWLSFGILSVLVASVGLIVLNARRSERLAGQQMDFVATVSHELRTPVTVIRSAAQNLSAGVVQDADQARKYGDLIEAEGRRLTDMVEQVLEYAGLSGNKRPLRAHPADVGAIVRDAVRGSAALLEAEDFRVDVSVAPDLPRVLADEEALRRALQNLIGNAVKYAADGRWIGIAVAATDTGRARDVQIAVSDRGRGVDPGDLPHLFEPFYRGRFAVDRQIHGNGLGLSLVKRIAEAHGGRVTVKSAAGQGSTFTVHLPAQDAVAEIDVPGHAEAVSPAGRLGRT